MSGAFYLSLTCETCGEDMYEGLVVTTLEHDGYPVIDLDLTASQIMFRCDNCGGVTWTGDYVDMTEHEPGEEPDEGEGDG